MTELCVGGHVSVITAGRVCRGVPGPFGAHSLGVCVGGSVWCVCKCVTVSKMQV